MRIGDFVYLAFKALKDRKLRSALTILGIIIGSAIIVALVASTRGLNEAISVQMEKTGITTLNVSTFGGTAVPLRDDDVRIISGFPGIREVIPYYSKRVTYSYGTSSVSMVIYGLDNSKLSKLYRGLGLANGAYIDGYDPTGAIIGSSLANPPDGSFPIIRLNEMIFMRGQSTSAGATAPSYALLVKGILNPYGAVGWTNIDETVFVTLTAARLLFKVVYYSGLYVLAESADVVESVTQNLQGYFGTNARIFSPSFMLQSVRTVTDQMTVFLGGIAAISLVVAGVGITNTMFVSVMERTREIGVLKAIGYKPKDIRTMFLMEAALTGAIGAVLGTIFGIVLSYGMAGALPVMGGGGRFRVGSIGGGAAMTAAGFMPSITFELIVFALTFPIAIAVLAGAYPSWRASRLNTVVALKYE